MGYHIGDDAPVAMGRDQDVHRRHASPSHRDHHHPAMPEGADKRPSLVAHAARMLGAFVGPTVGRVDKPDVELDRIAQRAVKPLAAHDPAAPLAKNLHSEGASISAASSAGANWVS